MSAPLLVLGMLVFLTGHIWVAVLASEHHAALAVAALLVPLVGLVFALAHRHEARIPLFLQAGGAALLVIARMVMWGEY